MNQQCKVCGEPAAGFHFGAFTCEGCKSFFGRTYNNMSSISECKNNGDCIINKKNRTSCKSCRLQKCLLVGMSKSGSRYGRRSNWFKIHCLLQEQGAAAANAMNGHPLSAAASSFLSGSPISAANCGNTSMYHHHHHSGLLNSRSPTTLSSTDKFLEARLNGFSPFASDKRSPPPPTTIVDRYHHHHQQQQQQQNNKHRGDNRKNSSEDSGGSSAGDVEEESSSRSAQSRTASHHTTPSPFSDAESGCSVVSRYNNNDRRSSSLDGSTNAFWKTPVTSTSPAATSLFRPLGPITYPVVSRPPGLLYLESIQHHTPWMAVRRNGLNGSGGSTASSPPTSVATRLSSFVSSSTTDEKPIDLSAKSSSYSISSLHNRRLLANNSPSADSYESSSRGRHHNNNNKSSDLRREDDSKSSQLPLDLTSKRAAHTREQLSTIGC